MKGDSDHDVEDASCSKGRWVKLTVVSDQEGDLAYVEETRHIPFAIKRVFYIYNVPHGKKRGNHAHRTTEQLIIAASGCFDVILDGGSDREKYHLDRPDFGLYVQKMTWSELECFSSGAVCLVLASQVFDEGDYLRDYGAFKRASRMP